MAVQMMLPGFTQAPGLSLAAPSTDLAAYPDVDPDILQRRAKEIGRAGELLVQSLLTRIGERCYPAAEEEPFDLLLMHPEAALRMQVKTKTNAQNGVYRFRMRRGYRGNPSGVQLYAPDAYDLAALVILPHNAVLFSAGAAETHVITRAQIEALRRNPYRSLHKALGDLGLSVSSSMTSIARN